MTTSRRGFITGLVSLIAAPAVVRATNLMPITKVPIVPIEYSVIVDWQLQPSEMIMTESFLDRMMAGITMEEDAKVLAMFTDDTTQAYHVPRHRYVYITEKIPSPDVSKLLFRSERPQGYEGPSLISRTHYIGPRRFAR